MGKDSQLYRVVWSTNLVIIDSFIFYPLNMTDKEIEKKREEFIEYEVQLYREMIANEKFLGVRDLDKLNKKKWQWIEELIKHYYTQGKIEGYKECLEENEWEMEEDKGFLFKDNKLIPIKKGFKLKTGKDQEVTKFKLGKDN